MKLNSVDTIVGAMRERGHAVFESTARPFNLNLVGVRTAKPELDAFKCAYWMFWPRTEGGWAYMTFPFTTLPGRYYLIDRLLNREGCAILVPGQYRGVWSLGLHRGKYEALCQRNGPVTVYRDGDRDEEFDYDPKMKRSGYYGINIHRAGANGYAPKVGANSAGCQVFANSNHFETCRGIWRKAAAYWGNKFTYTLLEDQ